MKRKRLLQLAVLVLVASGMAGGVWALLVRPVAVQIVETEHDAPVQVFGLGTVDAQILSRIGFEVAGTLIELQADYGDHVAARALVAHLDNRGQKARIDIESDFPAIEEDPTAHAATRAQRGEIK